MTQSLRSKVDERDDLIALAHAVGSEARGEALEALRRGDLVTAERLLLRHDEQLHDLIENLRIYQAELRAQADELAASQARTDQALQGFAALFSHMPVAVLRVAMSSEVVHHNARARDLFKLQPSSVKPRFLQRLVKADDYQARVRPALHDALATGAAAIESVTLMTEGGQAFEGELHIAALPTAAGEAPQFACAVLDRSVQQEHLRRLHEAVETTRRHAAFLGDSARIARIGGWEYAADTRQMRWSREMRALHDVGDDFVPSIDAMLGFCSEAGGSALAAALQAALAHGTPFQIEVDVHLPQGRAMRMLTVGRAEMEGGRCLRLLGVCQDITRQHQARQQIGELTERLNMAHEAGGIGVWDWDLVGGRLFVDDRMAVLLATSVERIAALGLREALRERLHGDDAERFDAAVQRAVQAGEPFALEVQLADAARPVRYLQLTGRAQPDAAGRAQRLVGCAWDSTTAKEAALTLAAKESAELASRAKSAFLSRMSHELRTPLNAIMGFSQLMRLEAERGDLVVKPHRARFIETAACHLLELINEVLDVSRIESGQLVLSMGPADLCQIVGESLPMVIVQAEEKGLRIEDRTAAAAPLWVHCDRLRLKEVVINLLSNAVKYNRPQGLVRIEAQTLGSQIELSVVDTGVGLDAPQCAELFQPFNRVGAESSRVEGSGMGLFVSKRFVDLMGGTIAVTSEPGVGSRFSVKLQAHAAAGPGAS